MKGGNLDCAVSRPHNQKQCSKCLLHRDQSHFYSKGSRQENICKTCKKKNRRSTYVLRRSLQYFDKLATILKLINEAELNWLDEQILKLDAILCRYQSKLAS
jgi:hypothetical protein